MKKLRPTPAGVIACVALAVALGGTAFAAADLVPKNSVGSAQIINRSLQKVDFSRRAVAALKGNRGPRGFQGVQGDPGVAGPTGPTGPAGPKGDKGATGDPWTLGNGTLPSGKTLRGVFGPGGTASGAGSMAQETVSFGFVLSAFPVVHFIGVGEAAPAECPGTITNPQAQPGHLCLFAAQTGNVSTVCVFNPVNDSCDQAAVRGFGVGITSAATGDFWLQGSWAVTAP
jgi:hypothetical protein